MIVTSENDCILVTLQGIKSVASKAVTSETLFTAETPEIAIRNSSKTSSVTVHYEWDPTFLVRKELWSTTYLIFCNFTERRKDYTSYFEGISQR